MNLAFRIITLSLAILGAIVSLVGFFALRSKMLEDKEKIALTKALYELARSGKGDQAKLAEMESELRAAERVVTAVPYLLVGSVMALVGGVLAMCRFPSCGAVWIFLSFLGPLVLNVRSIVCTFFLPLAFLTCMVACFVPSPAPTARRSRRDRDDDRDYRDDDRDYRDDRDRDDRDDWGRRDRGDDRYDDRRRRDRDD